MTALPRAAALFLAALVLPLTASAALKEGATTVLITGANRGIGLEYVNQLAARGWNVIATARKPAEATDLQAVAARNPQVAIEALDVADHAAVDALAAKYKNQPIDILLLNAGITPTYPSAMKQLSGVDFDMARQSFEVNAIGPLKMSQAFMPSVLASGKKQIVVLSSKAGSFGESPKMPFMYEYRASKAALDMYMYTLAFETGRKGVTLVLLSPGQVLTVQDPKMREMMKNMTIETNESVAKMLVVIDSLTPADNGKFLNYEDRRVIPW
ncbi:MAG: SDR family oxidoreductase [Gammaproteobacteria bacterium]|nr:SDR family oxidoreductase [Gammaproteobacteria bacterium]